MANTPSRIGLWLTRTQDPGDFDSLLNLLPEAALLIDKKSGSIQTINSALIKICAFTQAELRGHSIHELISEYPEKPVELGDEFSAVLNRRMREPVPVRMKVASVLSDGQIVITLAPEEVQAQPSVDEQPALFHILYDLSRVSDEADIDGALAKVTEITRAITGCEFVTIYQADPTYPQLKRIACTPECSTFPDVIASTDLVRLATPTLWRPGKRVMTELHRAGKMSNLAYMATTALGQENALYGLMAIADATRQPRENILQALAFIGDMVGGILQKSMLMNNLQRELDDIKHTLVIWNGLFDNCHEGVLVLNQKLQVVNMNPTIEALLGYASDEVIGLPIENILIGADGFSLALDHARKGLPTHNLGTVSLHHRDGHLIPVTIQTIPIFMENEMTSILVLIEDVTATEQIRLRTQQLEHRAVLGEFTAVFAHEVRNPINNISTGLQLLATRIKPEDPNQEVINRMQSDCGRLDHLMESVLSFSRPMENTFHPLDMGQVIQKVLDRWHPRLAKVNVKLFFQPSDNLPKVMGDQRSLEQVFTNLISNAVEAMSKTGGTLSIRIQPSDIFPNRPQLEIAVSDNGPGIPDELRDHIFDPFVTSSAKGTGLGLAITKRIVTAHQGTINVNSFPGGTVFHVYLPVIKGA
jgi:PAS domain S-box-containing protein